MSESNAEEPRPRWFIDMDWYERTNRSFAFLAYSRLCPKCRKRLKLNKGAPADKLLTAIKDCCSTSPDFIHSKLPVIECVFRIFLASGNEPLDADELVKRLSERCGYTYLPVETLSSLLARDQYYGLSQIKE